MHHYIPSYNQLWIYVVVAVILICVLIYFTAALMSRLDKWEERRKSAAQENKKDE